MTAEDVAHPPDDATPAELAAMRWNALRRRALQRVARPASILRTIGLVTVGFAGFWLLLATIGLIANLRNEGFSWQDGIVFAVIAGIGVVGGVLGTIILLGSSRMRELKSYRFVMAASLLTFLTGPVLLFCAPVCLLGVVPVFALLDADISWGFRGPEAAEEGVTG